MLQKFGMIIFKEENRMSEEKRLKARVAHKHKTEAEWYLDVYTAADSTIKRSDPFIPLNGELIIFDADENHEKRFKFGDGKTDVIALPFASNFENGKGTNSSQMLGCNTSFEGIATVEEHNDFQVGQVVKTLILKRHDIIDSDYDTAWGLGWRLRLSNGMSIVCYGYAGAGLEDENGEFIFAYGNGSAWGTEWIDYGNLTTTYSFEDEVTITQIEGEMFQVGYENQDGHQNEVVDFCDICLVGIKGLIGAKNAFAIGSSSLIKGSALDNQNTFKIGTEISYVKIIPNSISSSESQEEVNGLRVEFSDGSFLNLSQGWYEFNYATGHKSIQTTYHSEADSPVLEMFLDERIAVTSISSYEASYKYYGDDDLTVYSLFDIVEFAIADKTGAIKDNSFTQGEGTTVLNDSETALGKYNKPIEGTLLSVGNGTSWHERSNAFRVTEEGDVYIKNDTKKLIAEDDILAMSNATIRSILG